MNLTETEEALFKRWAMIRTPFVSDGLVDEKAYLESKIKLVFVLKEVSGEDEVDKYPNWNLDLRSFIRDGASARTWDNVARWVYGIRHSDREINWQELENISDHRKEYLKSICAFNLKKTPGRGTCDLNRLCIISTQDKEYLNEQFTIYNPDITICCGTGDLFCELMGIKPKRIKTNRGIEYCALGNNKHLIWYLHPQARIHSYFMFYGLIDAIKEIRRIVPA